MTKTIDFQDRLGDLAKVDEALWEDIDDLQGDLDSLIDRVKKIESFAALPVVARIC